MLILSDRFLCGPHHDTSCTIDSYASIVNETMGQKSDIKIIYNYLNDSNAEAPYALLIQIQVLWFMAMREDRVAQAV
jgi:hypothetical protein